MKHFLFLLLFTYASSSFSQVKYESFTNKYEELSFYAKPSKTNKLSTYFAKRIDSKLLNAYKISDTLKNRKYIYLTFKFGIDNKVTNVIVNSPYSELNKNIIEAFKNYNIDELNIPEKSPLNNYTLQILSKEGNQMVINCSTNIVYNRPPIFENCASNTTYSKLNNCLNKQLSEYIVNSISLTEIKKAKILGMLNLDVNFVVSEQGDIEKINCRAPTDSLTLELNRVVALFPKAKIPALRNGIPTRFIYKKTIGFQIDSDSEKYKQEIEKHNEEYLTSNDTLFNPNSPLALHFKKYIDAEELNKIVLPLKERSIYLSFNIDKKGNVANLKTNSNLPKLNDRLVGIFNKFPIETLNIKSSNVLESYRYPIIIETFNKKSIVSKDKPTVFIPPTFDKNCEQSKNPDELFGCLDQNISAIVKNNFIGNIKNKTELSGIIRISVAFQIDTDAKIINVKAFAPNPIIANELGQIIKNISRVYKAAYLDGKAIKTNYRYSYRFDLGENKIDDFENLTKTNYIYRNQRNY